MYWILIEFNSILGQKCDFCLEIFLFKTNEFYVLTISSPCTFLRILSAKRIQVREIWALRLESFTDEDRRLEYIHNNALESKSFFIAQVLAKLDWWRCNGTESEKRVVKNAGALKVF